MILLLKLVIICVIWCMGVTIVTQPGMILESLREWADKKYAQGNRWIEPAGLCHWCMPSFHSTIAYLFAILLGIIVKFEWSLIFMYPLVVMATSLCNGMIWGMHKLIEAKTKYYVNAEKLTYLNIKEKKKEYNRNNNG